RRLSNARHFDDAKPSPASDVRVGLTRHPLGRFSAEHVCADGQRPNYVHRIHPGVARLAFAAASVFPCVTRSLVGRLHVGCRTGTTASVERTAFSETKPRPAPGRPAGAARILSQP